MITDRIEVSEDGDREFPYFIQSCKCLLHHEFRHRIDALRGSRHRLIVWCWTCRAIDCTGRREDQMSDFIFVHDTSQCDASIHIVIIVLKWYLHALTDALHRGEVDHRIDRLYFEYATQKFFISNVADIAAYLRIRELFKTLMDRGLAVGEIVDDDGCIARFIECDDCMRADITKSAGDQDIFGHRDLV